jgi:hypothetical protein
MERKPPSDEQRANRLDEEEQQGLKLARRVQRALDPAPILPKELAKDPYVVEEPVEDLLQRRR